MQSDFALDQFPLLFNILSWLLESGECINSKACLSQGGKDFWLVITILG